MALSEAQETASRLMQVSPTYRIIEKAPIFELFISELVEAGLPKMAETG